MRLQPRQSTLPRCIHLLDRLHHNTRPAAKTEVPPCHDRNSLSPTIHLRKWAMVNPLSILERFLTPLYMADIVRKEAVKTYAYSDLHTTHIHETTCQHWSIPSPLNNPHHNRHREEIIRRSIRPCHRLSRMSRAAREIQAIPQLRI